MKEKRVCTNSCKNKYEPNYKNPSVNHCKDYYKCYYKNYYRCYYKNYYREYYKNCCYKFCKDMIGAEPERPGILVIKNNAPFPVYPLISFNPPGQSEYFYNIAEVPVNGSFMFQIPYKYATTIPAQGVSGRCYLFYENPNRPSGSQIQPDYTQPFQLTEFTFQYEEDNITPRMNFNISCVDAIGFPVKMECGTAMVSMDHTLSDYKNITIQSNPTITYPNPTTNPPDKVNSYKTIAAYNYSQQVPSNYINESYVNYYLNHISEYNPQTQDSTFIGTMVQVFGKLSSISPSMVTNYVFGGNPPGTVGDKWYDCVAALNRGVVYNDRNNINMFYTTAIYPINTYAKFVHVTLGFPVYAFPNDDHQDQGGFKVGNDYTLTITAAPLG